MSALTTSATANSIVLSIGVQYSSEEGTQNYDYNASAPTSATSSPPQQSSNSNIVNIDSDVPAQVLSVAISNVAQSAISNSTGSSASASVGSLIITSPVLPGRTFLSIQQLQSSCVSNYGVASTAASSVSSIIVAGRSVQIPGPNQTTAISLGTINGLSAVGSITNQTIITSAGTIRQALCRAIVIPTLVITGNDGPNEIILNINSATLGFTNTIASGDPPFQGYILNKIVSNKGSFLALLA